VLGREVAKIRARFGDKVEARTGDVTDARSLTAAMSGIDTVVNAVQFPGNPVEQPKRGWTFEQTDYKGTVNQVDAAKAAGVKRFVYLSGVGAAADAVKHWFRFKWQAEQYLQQSGLDWAVLRPTWIFGPGDHSLNRLIGFTKFLPFLPLFGNGKQAMQPVFIDDVARGAADLATKPGTTGVFEIGGPEVMTMNEVLKTGLEVLGRKRFILHQPVAVGKLIGTLASVLPSPPLSANAVDFICEPAVADNTAIEETLQPRLTPLREGLGTYLG